MKSLIFLICLIIPFTTYGIDWTIFENVHSVISCSSVMPSLQDSGTRIIFSSAGATPKETWMNRDETRPETLGSY